MKKLISVGVAMALLGLAVLPVGVAAQPPGCPDIGYTYPQTFAKIPFAIIQSGLELLENMWPDLDTALGIGMPWVGGVLGDLGGWAGGPLAWTVDMMGWGLGIISSIVGALGDTLGLPEFVPTVINEIVCSIFAPFDCVAGDPFEPCAG